MREHRASSSSGTVGRVRATDIRARDPRPAPVIEESRVRADERTAAQGERPTSCAGAVLIVAVWLLLANAGLVWRAAEAAPAPEVT